MPDSKPSNARARENREPTATAPVATDADWLALVTEKVATLKFGVVQIVVHDGRVVQVERTERHRFEPRANGGG